MRKEKVSDELILEAYQRTGSVWRAGEELNLCGQSVHERLQKMGIVLKEPEFTDEEIVLITRFYTERSLLHRDKFKLEDIAKVIGKSKQNICRKARKLGLTNINRRVSEEFAQKTSARLKQWYEKNEHPRGFLGGHHTDEVRKIISESARKMWETNEDAISGVSTLKGLKTKLEKGTLFTERESASWKGGKRIIGGFEKYYRSSWEANYARVLEFLKLNGFILKWEHEPDTFWFENIKRGVRSYTPDFKIWLTDTTYYYVEIKGWMDQKSLTKLKRFEKYYPENYLVLLRAKELKELKKKYSSVVYWE
jgi:hypothetical protein